MSFNVGINVIEVDGTGAPSIVGAATSVSGFSILTERGGPNTPTPVRGFPEFVQRFGSYFAGGLGAYLVKGFFDNGGRTAIVNRVVDTDPVSGALSASRTLADAAGEDTLRLQAGYRGAADPGTWGNRLRARVTASSSASSRVRETARASVQSTNPLAAQTDMSTFPALSILIDGETTPTGISFQPSDFANAVQATPAEIRNAINARTGNLVASIAADNRLVLTSTGEVATLTQGWSGLQVTAANAVLGFTAMTAPVRGTAAAIAATGTQLATVSGFQVGDAVRITDGASTAMAKLLSINIASGAITWTPALGTPGGFSGPDTSVQNVEFDITLALGGNEAENVVETWSALSMEPDLSNYAPAVLNDSIRGSKYVIADDENSPSAPGLDVPAVQEFQAFDPGRDGTPSASAFIGDSAAGTGLYAFDPVDIQLLCSERSDAAIVSAALGYCAERGDCMFVGFVPEGLIEAGQAVAYGKAFQGKKQYGALYGPHIKVLDPLSASPAPFRYIPPVGHVMGVYARIESTRGIWKAPAGDEANLVGALDVDYTLSDAKHTDLVTNGSINGIRPMPGAGIVIDASRTLSTDTRWLYVNVRLLFNYVKSSLRRGLRWVRQEPNRDRLWNLVEYGSVTPFLLGLWRQGAFGTGSPADVFTVIVDESNNPPDQVEQGNLKVEVYFYPSRPAETIVIIVGQQPSGGIADEA